MSKLKYKDGIIYNTKCILLPNYKAIMLFWFIFTKESPEEFDKIEIYHEQIHQMQYKDCIGIGFYLAIIIMFTMFALGIQSLWMIMLVLIPFVIYYVLYGLNFLALLIRYMNWGKAYKNICFEKQAYALEDEGVIVCQQRTPYVSLSWLKYL